MKELDLLEPVAEEKGGMQEMQRVVQLKNLSVVANLIRDLRASCYGKRSVSPLGTAGVVSYGKLFSVRMG